ncbi:MAG: manganese efflux pump MntP family protein [Desulfuromusa sp.]|nr:manganese efflux pump MntP family protein [Desulfuromusa sp.]
MEIITLLGIAIALGVDAFAVALASGAMLDPLLERRWFRLSFHFGLFQGLMPILGWLAGLSMHQWINAYNYWIACGLLFFVGGRMVFEALRRGDEQECIRDVTRGGTMVMLSIATSIDALAVGFSLALLEISIWIPALVIGVIAAVLTAAGMLLGRKIGALWGPRVEIAGGMVLCGIGIKILVDHLF